ncbi:MAG TPA: site-2 protease family protein, partial [Solirubrobacteraceae bacterium]|nr:site-2 protease family protein [Solirubrobacteraceae bacterium]
MVRRTNFQLARVFGIRIGAGISWFVVLFLFVIALTPYFHEVLGGSQTNAYFVTVAIVLSFFVSVILHELGHALVAKRNGLAVLGIDLWAFGGLTRSEPARTPGSQLGVAVAGPAVTFAIVVLATLAAHLTEPGGHFTEVATAGSGVHATPLFVWLSWLATVNMFVLVFNLIPAFPLDGGQIAQ